MLPIGAAALAFLLLLPLALISSALAPDIDHRWMYGLAAATAVVVTAVLVRWKLFWSITLDRDALQVGRWWPTRVPYERIRYLSSGAATDAIAAVRKPTRQSIPFVFATGMFLQRRLFLRREDAERCLRDLYARSPNAGAIDADGNVFPPRNRDAMPFARIRLAETLAVRGIAALCSAVGAAIGYALVNGMRIEFTRVAGLWIVLPLIPGLLVYGFRSLSKMRRVLQGKLDKG